MKIYMSEKDKLSDGVYYLSVDNEHDRDIGMAVFAHKDNDKVYIDKCGEIQSLEQHDKELIESIFALIEKAKANGIDTYYQLQNDILKQYEVEE